jgi:hypothetical protein
MDTATKTEGHAIPWNKGKLLGQKPPLKLIEMWAIRIRLQLASRARELALFNLAIDSKLRGCSTIAIRSIPINHYGGVSSTQSARRGQMGSSPSHTPVPATPLALGECQSSAR